MANVLYIGNKNYSSWSLRPWLCLRWAKIPFEDKLIRFDQPGYGKQAIAEVAAVAPNGRVPALDASGFVIWDSLAIAEWAAEEAPEAKLWPQDRRLRTEARAVVCEMHSGFASVRRDLSMNIRRRVSVKAWPADTATELSRLDALLGGLRARFRDTGPWLFGARTIADAFYAPIATRLRTYGVEVSTETQSYCDAVFADASFREWEEASIPNSWDVSGYSVIDGMYA
jgi:glutathione S-transferase